MLKVFRDWFSKNLYRLTTGICTFMENLIFNWCATCRRCRFGYKHFVQHEIETFLMIDSWGVHVKQLQALALTRYSLLRICLFETYKWNKFDYFCCLHLFDRCKISTDKFSPSFHQHRSCHPVSPLSTFTLFFGNSLNYY